MGDKQRECDRLCVAEQQDWIGDASGPGEISYRESRTFVGMRRACRLCWRFGYFGLGRSSAVRRRLVGSSKTVSEVTLSVVASRARRVCVVGRERARECLIYQVRSHHSLRRTTFVSDSPNISCLFSMARHQHPTIAINSDGCQPEPRGHPYS